MKLPDPEASRAVLIGAYAYRHLPDLAGVRGNVEALQEYLTGPAGWALPRENCLARPQPGDPCVLADELFDAAEAATDTLLIYYAGHGDPGSGGDAAELRLAMHASRADRPGHWLRYGDVREAVRRSPAQRRIVVLDCCYAGRAIDGGMSAAAEGRAGRVPGPRLFELADMDGAVVLTAASGVEQAMCPPGWEFSAFTGALVDVLRNGVTGPVPHHPEGRLGEELRLLDVTTVHACLRERLTGREVSGRPLPEPQLGTRNQGGAIALGPNPAFTGGPATRVPAPAVPSNLPAPDPVFIGRGEDLARLEGSADAVLADGRPATWLVHGMGGVGKTALVEQAAARLKDRFPDGRIAINLNGFESETDTAGGVRRAEPLSAEGALERLLSIVRHPEIPADLAQRADEWRAWLSGRRVLLVLDNAADARTIAPLLPGADAHCLVLVSSRSQDFAVPATHRIALGGMGESTAVALLKATGDLPAEAAPEAELAELARRCCYLPVVLRTIGAALRNSSPGSILAAMDDDSLAEFPRAEAAVRGAFQISYDALPAELRDVLHHCAWHPGRSYSAESVAAMIGVPEGRADTRLGRLLDVHLLQRIQGAITFHDLYLPLARATAGAGATDGQREARGRLYGYLLARVSAALLALYGPSPEWLAAAGSARFESPQAALGWLRDRSAALEASASAALSDEWEDAGRLATECGRWLRHDFRHGMSAELAQQALDLADDTGDRRGQMYALTDLGHSDRLRNRYATAASFYRQALDLVRGPDDHRVMARALWGLADMHRVQSQDESAVELYRQALELAEETGDRLDQTNALTGLADTLSVQGRDDAAAELYRQALDLARATGNRLGQTNALTGLGNRHRVSGEYDVATEHFREALGLAVESGNRQGQMRALDGLADSHLLRNQYETAAELYQQALGHANDTSDRHGQANALWGLGHCHRALAGPEEAERCFRAALELFVSFGDHYWADQCRLELGES
ncbi:tetratricopeptide repeat protein [Streptomyces sp. NPDC050145]|uniref:caspase, EACC1-associated type n=1 Tax=Streptomyces sp. NPDC050145 TaxID=3365602 RepID=UPI0037932382